MIQEEILEKALAGLFGQMKFTQEPAGLYDPLRYMMSIGGKRIRPRLCLTAYSLYRDSLDDSILEPAAALEIFHSFTLLHDDIMDKSEMRRGVPTVWKKWNEDTAILSGDVMSIESYRRMAMAPNDTLPEVLALFTRTAAQVCEGQQLDMDFEEQPLTSMSDYMKMIGLKTAVLIAASAKIGAIIAGAPAADADKLYNYGYDLGLAFQVADDLLDAYGDEKVFGKPIGGDIVNNKKSWLQVRTLEKSMDPVGVQKIMDMPVSTKEQRNSKIAAMMKVYADLDIEREAREEVVRLNDRALAHISGLPGEDALRKYADGLVGRAK